MTRKKPCRYLDNRGDSRVYKNRVYPCTAPDPVLPPMPVSITGAWTFREKFQRKYVCTDDCADCPIYTPKEPTP
jgi:hypothetical protein